MMRALLLCFLCGLLVGCGGGSTASLDVVGSYTLATIDGVPLPDTIGTDPARGPIVVTAGSTTIASGGSWNLFYIESFPQQATVDTISYHGLWSFLGSTLALSAGGGGGFTAQLSGQNLSVSLGADVFVFRKD